MTGLFIIARLGSTRLERKHLITVGEKTFIEVLAGRFCNEFSAEVGSGTLKIVIATSKHPENREFEMIFKGSEVDVFYGDDMNIPLRQLECADHYGIDLIISIDGDDVLCSPSACRMVLNKLKSGEAMVKTVGLPLGMNVSGYRTDFLKSALATHPQKKLETGWGKIFDSTLIDVIDLHSEDYPPALRMTLDYQKDADFFSTVINSLGEKVFSIDDGSLIQLIVKNKWHHLNECLSEEYWHNFNKNQRSEFN